MKSRAAVLCIVALACAHHRSPGAAPTRVDLNGLRARLLPELLVRAAVAGQVNGGEAEVRFDPASALSLLSGGCAHGLEVERNVQVPLWSSAPREVPVATVSNVRIGDRGLTGLQVGVASDVGPCVLTLGSDVLKPFALYVNTATRELWLEPSRAHDAYFVPTKGNVSVIELSPDPLGDFPLLAVRAKQGRAAAAGTYVLSLVSAHTRIFSAGKLSQREDVFGKTDPAAGRATPPVVDVDAIELSPTVAVDHLSIAVAQSGGSVDGVLGADVWGRFRVIGVDLAAGVLTLERPWSENGRCRSEQSAPFSAEECFALQSQPVASGVDTTIAVWRPLPEGGRVFLQPVDEKGGRLTTTCRMGFTFPVADAAGATLRHVFPWAAALKGLPECEGDFTAMKHLDLALFDDSAATTCPTECAFVENPRTGRAVCDCAPTLELSSLERRVFDEYQKTLERKPKPSNQEEPEPQDAPPAP